MDRAWPWALGVLCAAALAAAAPGSAHAQALPSVQPVSIDRVNPVSGGVQAVHTYRMQQAANAPLYRPAGVTIGRGTIGSLARSRLFSPYGAAISAVILGAGLLIDYLAEEIYREGPAMPPATGRYLASVYGVNCDPGIAQYIPDLCARVHVLNGFQMGSDSPLTSQQVRSAFTIYGANIFGKNWGGVRSFSEPRWGETTDNWFDLAGFKVDFYVVWWDTAAGASPVPWPDPPTTTYPLTDEELADAILPNMTPSDLRDLLTDPVTGRPVPVPEMAPVMEELAGDAAAQTDDDPTNDPPPEKQAEERPFGCAIFPPFCDFVDWVKRDDGPPETPDLPVEQVPEPQGWFAPIPANSACPAPQQISISLPGGRSQTIQYSYDPICQGVSMMRPIVLAFAYLSAAFIMLGIPFRGASDD